MYNFFYQINKVLPDVIHVNQLVYRINGEVWKHVLLANGFNYLISTFNCLKQQINPSPAEPGYILPLQTS